MSTVLLASWPWNNLGFYKYILYAPLIGKAVASRAWEAASPDRWILLLLVLFGLRALTYQLWSSFSNMLFATRRRCIVRDGVDYKQIDKEWDWDNFLILQILMAAVAFYVFPSLRHLPLWDARGLAVAVLLHVVVTEPLFYASHRAFHSGHLFSSYHALHHSIKVPQPFTAGFATPLEHMVLSALMAVPLAGACAAGFGSVALALGYVLGFDFLRAMGHCNVEVFPSRLFSAIPVLRYIIYTPTYHTIHHTKRETNFCLFMPLFDLMGGTLHAQSWEMQKQTSAGVDEVPHFVFLAHLVDMTQSLHVPFVLRSYASMPFSVQLFLVPMWPVAFLVMLLVSVLPSKSKTFLISCYNLRGRLHQMWVVPSYGPQYFLSFAQDGINRQIEQTILSADKMGVKVIGLAGLNKNEALNGGGTLYVKKHPDLRVRVSHGNTLTAAAILNEIPKGTAEVFLTGATSKLDRAIALYLCRKRVRVMMLTLLTERFEKIQREAAPEFREYLVQVTEYDDTSAQRCKTWLVGKWMTVREQLRAPAGTHFLQFAVPSMVAVRRDCTYGKTVAMRLPPDVRGLGVCEYTLERGVVHACHAGGLLHFLEGYAHHEVGAIDVDRIDVVWEAVLRQRVPACLID